MKGAPLRVCVGAIRGGGPFCQTGRRGDARLELPEAKDSGDPEEVTQKAERVALLLPESRLS